MKTKAKTSSRSGGNQKSFPVSVFFGTLLSLCLGSILLLMLTFIALRLPDPGRFAPIMALFALFATALSSGYLSSRAHKEKGLLTGFLSGLLLVGILVLCAFAFSLSIRWNTFMIAAPAAVVCAAIAGVCGVSTPQKPKHKRKKGF